MTARSFQLNGELTAAWFTWADEADTKTESKEPKANRDRYNGIATSGLDIAGGFGEGDGKRTLTNTDTSLQRDVCNVCLHPCLIVVSRVFLGCVKHVNQ